MIFKLLVSLEKLSYGSPSVKGFELYKKRVEIGFGTISSRVVKNHLQDFPFGYKKSYALFFY